jgi:hypothetical protein
MTIYTDIDLSPNVQKFLPVLPEEFFFHKDYNLKHPSAIYNSSISKIEASLKDFLDIYNRFTDVDFESVEKKYNSELTKNYKFFLYSLREHLDDCFHIVKCFTTPPRKENPDRNQAAWLKKNHYEITKDFFENIKPYKDYIDQIVNELKHNNGSIQGTAFYNEETPSEHCLGFFIANVINDVYEPVEKIHPQIQGIYTAFSYRRDLTYNLYNVFLLSEEIINFLKKNTEINFNLINPKSTKASDSKVVLYKQVMSMPLIHFPDEYIKPVPSLSLTKQNTLKLEYPSQLTIRPNKLNRVVTNHTADGHTGTFRVPYM